jgi:hypothetical protein
MMSENLIEASRRNWRVTSEKATLDEIKTGCLQRIASSTELMVRNYRMLLNDCEIYQQMLDDEQRRREIAERRIRALRGVITKMKRRQAQ